MFRYGIATGRCQRDPSADLKGALKVNKTTSYACLDIKEMPEFLEKLQRNDARLFATTRRAIKILMLTFVRTGELINATWDEFDLDNATWEIPCVNQYNSRSKCNASDVRTNEWIYKRDTKHGSDVCMDRRFEWTKSIERGPRPFFGNCYGDDIGQSKQHNLYC